MEWLNFYGLAFVVAIMVPNIFFAIKGNNSFENRYRNKLLEAVEQIGRYGCMAFMVLNVPGLCLGFPSELAFVLYLVINGVLVVVYCAIWIVCWRTNTVFRALALSILPSLLFLVSGLLCRSYLLISFAVIFAATHIFISYKSAAKRKIS